MEKIIWSESAIEDLAHIYHYIALDSKFYANRLIDQIYTRVSLLETHPHIGRIVPEKNDPNIREMIEGNYRIMYTIKDNGIIIYRIINTSQLFKV